MSIAFSQIAVAQYLKVGLEVPDVNKSDVSPDNSCWMATAANMLAGAGYGNGNTGIMTNLFCETTARNAFVKDYRAHFMIDATATSVPALHEATLMNLAYGFTYLHKCGELIHYLNTLE